MTKKDMIMTAAQQLRQEGIHQGRVEGIKEGIKIRELEIAKSMLRGGESMEKIMTWTKLTKQEIEKLHPNSKK